MAVKVLMPGTFFSFGQCRGKEVDEIFESNPSYIYWCFVSGTARLAPELVSAIQKWASENPKEAARVRGSVKNNPALAARGKAMMEEMARMEEELAEVGTTNPRTPVSRPLNTAEVMDSWGDW